MFQDILLFLWKPVKHAQQKNDTSSDINPKISYIWEKHWRGSFDWRRSTSTFYIFIPGGFWKCGIDTFPSIEVIPSLLIIITIVFLATFTCTDSHFPLYLVLHCVFERSTCSPVSQTLFRWKVNLTISHLRLSPRLI